MAVTNDRTLHITLLLPDLTLVALDLARFLAHFACVAGPDGLPSVALVFMQLTSRLPHVARFITHAALRRRRCEGNDEGHRESHQSASHRGILSPKGRGATDGNVARHRIADAS